jgi:hypothetical protein
MINEIGEAQLKGGITPLDRTIEIPIVTNSIGAGFGRQGIESRELKVCVTVRGYTNGALGINAAIVDSDGMDVARAY